MFTGIVEELGEVVAIEPLTDASRLTVRGPVVTSDASHGDSISVNGVCLTVVDTVDGAFTADVMAESLKRSSLGALQVGSPVNLERAVRVQDRLGGHVVQGHVDGTGEVLAVTPDEHWTVVRTSLPGGLGRVSEHGDLRTSLMGLGDLSCDVCIVDPGGSTPALPAPQPGPPAIRRPAPPQDAPVPHDHAAHCRVRPDPPQTPPPERQRQRHPAVVIHDTRLTIQGFPGAEAPP